MHIMDAFWTVIIRNRIIINFNRWFKLEGNASTSRFRKNRLQGLERFQLQFPFIVVKYEIRSIFPLSAFRIAQISSDDATPLKISSSTAVHTVVNHHYRAVNMWQLIANIAHILYTESLVSECRNKMHLRLRLDNLRK